MTLALYKSFQTHIEHWHTFGNLQKGQKVARGFPPVDPIEEDPRVALCRRRATASGPLNPSHDLEHVKRVVALSRHLARVEGADEALVVCAAYLHDMERGREDAGGEDHAVAGARSARELLPESGLFSPEDIGLVAEAIASHRYRSGPPPSTMEARCLHDADKLDALGAVGVGRAYMMAGEHGQRLHSQVPEGVGARHVGDIDHSRYSPVEEYTVKLRHLPDRMTTDEGKRLALRRAEFMASFFDELEAEVGGDR